MKELPEGFTLDPVEGVGVGLPPGFELDQPGENDAKSDQLLPEDIFNDVGRGMGRGVAGIVENMANTYLSANAQLNKMMGAGDGTYNPVSLKPVAEEIFPDDGSTIGKVAEFAPEIALLMTGWGAGEAVAARGVAAAPKLENLLSQEQTLSRLADWSLKTLAGSVGSQVATGKMPEEGRTATDYAINALINRGSATLGWGYRAIKGSPDAAKKALVDEAERQGVSLVTTDVFKPQTFLQKSFQTVSENIPLIGMGSVRAAQQEERVKAIAKLAEKYPESSFDDLVASVNRKQEKFREAAGKRYEAINKGMGDTPLDVTGTVKAIDEVLAKLDQPGRVPDKASINALREYRQIIADNPQSFELLKANRSSFRDSVRGERIALPKETDKLLNDIYWAMTKNLRDSVERRLGPDMARKYKEADEIYEGNIQNISKSRLKKIIEDGESVPDAARRMALSQNVDESKRLYNALDAKGKEAMRRLIIDEAISKSRSLEHGGIEPGKFVTQLRKFEKQFDAAFKGDEIKMINGLNAVLQASSQAGKAAINTPTGRQLLPVGLMGGAGASAWMSGTAIPALSLWLSSGAIARTVESKAVRDALIKVAGTPKGSTDFEKGLAEVDGALRAYLIAEASTGE